MDMIAGKVLTPGTAHGPLVVLDGLPEGAIHLSEEGRLLGVDPSPRLARAVVALRASTADRLDCLAIALADAGAALRPIGWLVPEGTVMPSGLPQPSIALDGPTLARLIPCPRASFQPGGRVWLT